MLPSLPKSWIRTLLNVLVAQVLFSYIYTVCYRHQFGFVDVQIDLLPQIYTVMREILKLKMSLGKYALSLLFTHTKL